MRVVPGCQSRPSPQALCSDLRPAHSVMGRVYTLRHVTPAQGF